MRPLAGCGSDTVGLPLRAFARAGVLQIGERGVFARTVVTRGRPPGRRDRGDGPYPRGVRRVCPRRSDGHETESDPTQI